MSMSLERFLPRAIPMTFGTSELRARAAEVWSSPVALLEPPVDTDTNHPGAVDPGTVHGAHRPPGRRPRRWSSSLRLSRDMKLDGIRRSIGAVARLAAERPVRLVIVGDGDAFEELSDDAAAVGRGPSSVTGAMRDPAWRTRRPTSSWHGGPPCGPWRSPSRSRARRAGLLRGLRAQDRRPVPVAWLLRGGRRRLRRLYNQLADLLDEPERAGELAEFGLRTVTERYALDGAAARLEQLYRRWPGSAPRAAGARGRRGEVAGGAFGDEHRPRGVKEAGRRPPCGVVTATYAPPTERLLVIGAGGLGREVAEAVRP